MTVISQDHHLTARAWAASVETDGIPFSFTVEQEERTGNIKK